MSKKDFTAKIAYNKSIRSRSRKNNIKGFTILCIITGLISFFGAGCDGTSKHDNSRTATTINLSTIQNVEIINNTVQITDATGNIYELVTE